MQEKWLSKTRKDREPDWLPKAAPTEREVESVLFLSEAVRLLHNLRERKKQALLPLPLVVYGIVFLENCCRSAQKYRELFEQVGYPSSMLIVVSNINDENVGWG